MFVGCCFGCSCIAGCSQFVCEFLAGCLLVGCSFDCSCIAGCSQFVSELLVGCSQFVCELLAGCLLVVSGLVVRNLFVNC